LTSDGVSVYSPLGGRDVPGENADIPRIAAKSRERKELTMINTTNNNVVVSDLQRDTKPGQPGRYAFLMYHC
jgi:hypothetical protein